MLDSYFRDVSIVKEHLKVVEANVDRIKNLTNQRLMEVDEVSEIMML